MSHTIRFGTTTFVHDGACLESELSTVAISVQYQGEIIDVPVRDLVEFVASLVAQARISKLEQSNPYEVLGVPNDARPSGSRTPEGSQ
jgi:hypothetical protein